MKDENTHYIQAQIQTQHTGTETHITIQCYHNTQCDQNTPEQTVLWDENTHYVAEVGGSHYSVSRWAGVAVKLCKLDFNWAEVTEEGG